jgi:hypothetical protein
MMSGLLPEVREYLDSIRVEDEYGGDDCTWYKYIFSSFSFDEHPICKRIVTMKNPSDVNDCIMAHIAGVRAKVVAPQPPTHIPVYDIMNRKELIYQFCIDLSITRSPESEAYIQKWIKEKEIK